MQAAVSVSRPDIFDRLARIAYRVDSSPKGDIYRINDLVETATLWQQAAKLLNSASSNPEAPSRGHVDGRMRSRGETTHCETMTPVGRSAAAYGDQSAEYKSRLGYVI